MKKDELMAIEKTKEFINAVIRLGYTESAKNGSNHRIFKAKNMPVLSIPNDRILSAGTRRNLVKLILGDKYYQ